MISLLIIPAASLLNLTRGRGYKLPSAIILGVIYGVLASSVINHSIHYDILAGLIVTAGFLIRNIVGTGDGFSVIHGRFDGIRKYNTWNRWVYKLSDKVAADPVREQKRWGFMFMSLRGLYTLPMTAGLSIVFLNPLILLLGFLGILQGVMYWIGGIPKEHKYSVVIAEILDGLVLGVILWVTLLIGG